MQKMGLNKDLPFTPRLSVPARAIAFLSVLSVLSVVQPSFAQTGSLEVDGNLKVKQTLDVDGTTLDLGANVGAAPTFRLNTTIGADSVTSAIFRTGSLGSWWDFGNAADGINFSGIKFNTYVYQGYGSRISLFGAVNGSQPKELITLNTTNTNNPYIAIKGSKVLTASDLGLTSSDGLVTNEKIQVNKDVRLNGKAFLWNNQLDIGHFNAPDSEIPGMTILYEDGGASTTAFRSSRGGANWQWSHYNMYGGGSYDLQMNLDQSNRLILYPFASYNTPPFTNGTIVLDPNGTGSISINGKKVLIGSSGTQNPLAIGSSNWGGDNIASSEFSFAVGSENVASGNGAIALGAGNVSSGYRSVALGHVNRVSGNYASALGADNQASGDASFSGGDKSLSNKFAAFSYGYFTKAQGRSSTAFGESSQANSDYSIAMGYDSWAEGQSAISIGQSNRVNTTFGIALGVGNEVTGPGIGQAFGYGCKVSAHAATANGWYTEAQGKNQFIVGSRNIPSGTPTDYTPLDSLFIVGNGSPYNGAPETRSNAFVVRWNGDTTVYGNLESTKKITAQEIKATGAVKIAPQGDLPMGEFTAGGL